MDEEDFWTDYGFDDSSSYDDSSSAYDTVATDDSSGYDVPASDSSAYDTAATDDSSSDLYPDSGQQGLDQFNQDQGYLYTDAAGNDIYADGTIGLADGSTLNPDGSYELADGSVLAANGDYTDAEGNAWTNLGFAGAPQLYQDANGDIWNAGTGEVTPSTEVSGNYVAAGSTQAAPAATAPKASTSAGGGSGGGGSSIKLPQTTTPPKPATSASSGAAPAKTIVSDQRIGNDRYLVYSDGSSQRLANYYQPAAGATTPTAGSVLGNLLGTAGQIVGAINAPSTVAGAPKLPTVNTSATPITGLLKPPAGANPTVPVVKPTSTGATSSSGLGLLALGALALKVFILH